MKIIDLTGHIPMIGGEKQNWLFRCERCGYETIFMLWNTWGMSTACEICGGDMERINRVVIGKFKDPEKSGELQVRNKFPVPKNAMPPAEYPRGQGCITLREFMAGEKKKK